MALNSQRYPKWHHHSQSHLAGFVLVCPTGLALTGAGVLGALQSGTAETPYFVTAVHPLTAEAKAYLSKIISYELPTLFLSLRDLDSN